MIRSRLSIQPPVQLDEPTVNLTPLIDVVFVILIMFIVIAPLLELDHIELADHSHASLDTAHSVQESSPIVIHVHKDNSIWLNNQPVTAIQLVEELKQAKVRFPQATPQIFHDRYAQFGIYQSIKNAAEEAGYSEIDIILKPA